MELVKLDEKRGLGDSLTLNVSGGSCWIEIDEPWAGDTQSGIGRSSSFTITKDQAVELANALLKWAQE